MAKKQTIPLSQIVDHATNEVHPSPNIKAYQTINKVVTTIPSAQVALRVQLIAKMKAYCNKFLNVKEMYYSFCLVDYVVTNCVAFRPQVANKDFLSLFERCCDFDRARKGKKIGIVTEKGMELLQKWATVYGKELVDYRVMFDKYNDKGLHFPVLEQPVKEEEHQQLSTVDELEKCRKEIEECEAIIKDNLKYKSVSNRMQSIKNLHKRAVELNSKYNVLYVKFMNEKHDSNELTKYSEIEKNFTEMIHQLANIINNPQEEDTIYRTYTTGHVNFNQPVNELNQQKQKQPNQLKQNQTKDLINLEENKETEKPNQYNKMMNLLPITINDTTKPNNETQTTQSMNQTFNLNYQGRLTPRQRIPNIDNQSIQSPRKRIPSTDGQTIQSPRMVPQRISRTNSSNSINLAPPPSRGQPLRLSRQNTEENVSYSSKQSFAPKIQRTTSQFDSTESSQVKNRFIFETVPSSDLSNSNSFFDTHHDGSIL